MVYHHEKQQKRQQQKQRSSIKGKKNTEEFLAKPFFEIGSSSPSSWTGPSASRWWSTSSCWRPGATATRRRSASRRQTGSSRLGFAWNLNSQNGPLLHGIICVISKSESKFSLHSCTLTPWPAWRSNYVSDWMISPLLKTLHSYQSLTQNNSKFSVAYMILWSDYKLWGLYVHWYHINVFCPISDGPQHLLPRGRHPQEQSALS